MKRPIAAFICIGNEILSGRTRDENIHYLANWLTVKGIKLFEVRVVGDEEEQIIQAIHSLRDTHSYVFTSGGIGTTHDDITSACIAKACDTSLELNLDAKQLLDNHYKARGGITDARLKMATLPQGCELITNGVSGAPGFRLQNIYVLAGVPSIFKAMLGCLGNQIENRTPQVSKTIDVYIGESRVANLLTHAQDSFPEVEIGSYPQYNEQLGYYTSVVCTADSSSVVDDVFAHLATEFSALEFTYSKPVHVNFQGNLVS